jgi:DNA-binding transcriptional LysR family regulator
MELRQLRCFVTVAEELHFGHAAERLGIAPPALSRQVRALEQEIGVPLLTRTTREVALTRAGLVLLEEAKIIIARIERSVRLARDASTNSGRTLRIGAIDAASASFLPAILVAFRAANPTIDVKFVEAMTAPLMQMLDSGKLDLCLIRPPKRPSDCAFETLRVERPLVVLPTSHPLASAPFIAMEDLRDEPFIIPSKRGRPYAHDLVMTYFESIGAMPQVTIEATEKPAMMSAVAAGLGIALAPDWVARLSFPGVTVRRLKGMLLDPPPPGAQLGVAWRPAQRLATRDAFLALLRERVTLLDETISIPFAPFADVSAGRLFKGAV